MNIKSKLMVKCLLAFIVTLLMLLLGQLVWQNYAVNTPLEKSLESIDGVKSIVWDKNSKIVKPLQIEVTLGNVVSIQKTYKEINQRIGETLGAKPYNILIKDNRTPELENIYNGINNYVQKAILDGDFPLLAQKTKDIAEQVGVNAKVFVDEQYVYVQLNKEDTSLYMLILRHSNENGGIK